MELAMRGTQTGTGMKVNLKEGRLMERGFTIGLQERSMMENGKLE
jgi:hypothetical protein